MNSDAITEAFEGLCAKRGKPYQAHESDTPPLHYDYTASRTYCESIGLIWLGDDFLTHADAEAARNGFTQNQVNVAMRHHLWQVRWLFEPSHYHWYQRLLIALFFITGWRPR